MIIDIFSELQRAQPWSRAGEATVIANALEQAQLCDQLGYGCWFSVEHHGATEFSLSSTPDLFNVALAMSTRRLRIGHAGVLAPYGINHPVKVAERAAFVDIISNGRLEMGLARSTTNEWQNFDIDPAVTPGQARELLRLLPMMWTQDEFSWKGETINIPPMNVVPKPVQKPHPRLWQTGTNPEGAAAAGGLGIGYLATTLLTPLSSLAELLDVYKKAVAACTDPAGQVINDQFGLFTFVHCAETKDEAIRSRAAEAAMWYINRAPAFFKAPRDRLIGNIRGSHPSPNWRLAEGMSDEDVDPDDPHPIVRALNRSYLGLPQDPGEVYEALDTVDSLIIGDPEHCRQKMEKVAGMGFDRLLCLQQFGHLPHARVMRSIRLIGEEILPYL